jgi:hypothetical protein
MPSIPLSIPDELAQSVSDAAKLTKLSQQETMRQAIRFGLPVLCDKWPKPYCNPALRRGKKGGAS